MQKIKSIEVVHSNMWQVGSFGVKEIVNQGAEFEDSIYSQYDVIGENGSLIVSIENAPVVVTYIPEEKED